MDQERYWHVDNGHYRISYYNTVERARVDLSQHVYRLISTPEAHALSMTHLNSSPRILVVGQETHGNYQSIVDRSAYDAWSCQIGGSIAFDFAFEGDTRLVASKFWRAFDEIAVALKLKGRRALAWSNLVKVQLVEPVEGSHSISKLPAADQMAVVRWQRELFRTEFEYVKPDAIIFLIGGLHWILGHMFYGHSQLRHEDFHIVRIEGLDIPMVQTSHPNARMGSSVGVARANAVSYLKAELGF